MKNNHRWCMRYEWPDGTVGYGPVYYTKRDLWERELLENTEKNRRACRRDGNRPVKVTIVEGWLE
jgi:hypothetical protein